MAFYPDVVTASCQKLVVQINAMVFHANSGHDQLYQLGTGGCTQKAKPV